MTTPFNVNLTSRTRFARFMVETGIRKDTSWIRDVGGVAMLAAQDE